MLRIDSDIGDFAKCFGAMNLFTGGGPLSVRTGFCACIALIVAHSGSRLHWKSHAPRNILAPAKRTSLGGPQASVEYADPMAAIRSIR